MTLGRELELYKTKENSYRLRSILSSNLGDYESMAIEKQSELIKENTKLREVLNGYVEKQMKRRTYMREYMRKARAEGKLEIWKNKRKQKNEDSRI